MEKMIYLDNAATSFPKPESVHERMGTFYRRYGVNPGRTGADIALKAEEMIRDAREKLSRLFNESLYRGGKGKNADRLVFAANATASLNLVLQGTLSAGDHVVTTWTEHNSVIRPVNHLGRLGVESTFVRPDGAGDVDPEAIRAAIKGNTRLVIVNHASNVTGVVQDIPAIAAVCREAGVPMAIDAAQTAGVLDIDMAAWGVSFVAFTGHKGLLGPTGTGGVCVADDAEIASSIWGGTGVKSAHPYHLEEFPYRLEAGTLNLQGIAGLSAGVDWVLERGLGAIRAHEIDMLGRLQDGLREIPGVHIRGNDRLERRVATLSVVVDNYDPSDVGTLLDVDHNVLTRTGLQCAPLMHEHLGTSPRGTVRFSVGPFTTEEDVDAAVAGVREIALVRNGRAVGV